MPIDNNTAFIHWKNLTTIKKNNKRKEKEKEMAAFSVIY